MLSLQWVFYGATLNNLSHVLVDTMVLYGDSTQEVMVTKFIRFGTNEVYVFQVMAQIQMGQKTRSLDFVLFGPCVKPTYIHENMTTRERALDFF